MVSTPAAKRRTHKLKTHVFTKSLPEGSIIAEGNGLFVSSPELCFFQMDSELPFAKHLELGLELCGSYALPVMGVSTAERHLYNRRQLANKERLIVFLSRMEGVFGQRRLMRVLQYLADNSASPRETTLYLLLTLPYRHGGYGFPMPVLNAKIRPAKTAKETSSKTFFRCDLYWPDLDVAVEYDSDRIHLTPQQIASDAMKRNSLIAMGVTVITVTNRQITSTMGFERVAKQLAVSMGRRLRSNESAGFVKARNELRALLGL